LLYHFPTKDELLLEVVRSREERTGPHVDEHLHGDRFEIREAILALAEINDAESVEQLLLTTLSAEAIPADHPLHEHFVARYRETRRRLTAILQREQGAGPVRPELDASQVVCEVIATLDGIRLQWLLDPDEVDLKQRLGAYADRLDAAIRVPTKGRARKAGPTVLPA
jgi:AcrR family transcriptional regulator